MLILGSLVMTLETSGIGRRIQRTKGQAKLDNFVDSSSFIIILSITLPVSYSRLATNNKGHYQVKCYQRRYEKNMGKKSRRPKATKQKKSTAASVEDQLVAASLTVTVDK